MGVSGTKMGKRSTSRQSLSADFENGEGDEEKTNAAPQSPKSGQKRKATQVKSKPNSEAASPSPGGGQSGKQAGIQQFFKRAKP